MLRRYTVVGISPEHARQCVESLRIVLAATPPDKRTQPHVERLMALMDALMAMAAEDSRPFDR